ncbi:hypothetical protein GPALN_009804 [Globodera pallida]|nr:hypothetical protein GPALN_009804 [Globodera pallida]
MRGPRTVRKPDDHQQQQQSSASSSSSALVRRTEQQRKKIGITSTKAKGFTAQQQQQSSSTATLEDPKKKKTGKQLRQQRKNNNRKVNPRTLISVDSNVPAKVQPILVDDRQKYSVQAVLAVFTLPVPIGCARLPQKGFFIKWRGYDGQDSWVLSADAFCLEMACSFSEKTGMDAAFDAMLGNELPLHFINELQKSSKFERVKALYQVPELRQSGLDIAWADGATQQEKRKAVSLLPAFVKIMNDCPDCQCPIVGYSCMRPVPYNKPVLCVPKGIVGHFPNFPPEPELNFIVISMFLATFLMLTLQIANLWLFYNRNGPPETPVLVSYRKESREVHCTVTESRPVSPLVEPPASERNQSGLAMVEHGRNYYSITADISDTVKDEENGYAED